MHRITFKFCYVFIGLVIVSLLSCEGEGLSENKKLRDTIPPVIHLTKRDPDTVLLQVSSMTLVTNNDNTKTFLPGNSVGDYMDDAVNVLDDVNGELCCVDYPIETSGYVNNKMPGVYTLTYNTMDPSGNRALPVTRRVCVAESNVAYLNGDYEAVSTNTIQEKGTSTLTVSTSEYTVHVFASPERNNQFDLTHLKIGSHFVKPFTLNLRGTSLDVGFFDRDFNIVGNTSTGTLSPSTKSFTIETTTYLYSPSTKYSTQNVFKKIISNP